MVPRVALRNDGLGIDGDAQGTDIAPTCRLPHSVTSDISTPAWKTCFTTSWPCCTIPPIVKPTPGALRMEWPRIPLPGWPDGDASEAAETLARSAARGRELAALLDP